MVPDDQKEALQRFLSREVVTGALSAEDTTYLHGVFSTDAVDALQGLLAEKRASRFGMSPTRGTRPCQKNERVSYIFMI